MTSENTTIHLEDPVSFRNLLLPSVFALNIIAAIGFYGHISLIWSTFKYRFLQNPCNILIALLALGDFGHQLAHPIYGITVLSGNIFIRQETCYWLQFIPCILMLHSIIMILNLGIDRLFCVISPHSYMWTGSSKITYLFLHNILAISYCALVSAYSYREMKKNPDKDTLCLIVGFFAGNSQDLWALSALGVSGITVILYVFIWRQVKKTTEIAAAAKDTLKPLTIIIVLYVCGWFAGMVTVAILLKLDLSDYMLIGLSSYIGLFINSTISANYFVYKYFGSDYRKAFKHLWKPGTSISHYSERATSRGLSN